MTFRRSARSAVRRVRKRRLAALTARVFRTIARPNPNKAGGEMHTALMPEVDYDPYDVEELKIQ